MLKQLHALTDEETDSLARKPQHLFRSGWLVGNAEVNQPVREPFA